jgi:hypothetical protein
MNVSTPVLVCFVLLVLAVVSAVALAAVLAGRRARDSIPTAQAVVVVGALGAWLAVTDAVARSGALLDFSGAPPRFSRFVAVVSVATVLFGFSGMGERMARAVPLTALVGFQTFRLPVELLLAELHREGAIPVQMTFAGWNFDVVTGLSAVVVAFAVHRGKLGTRALLAWNTAGLVLLATIVAVANLSTPAFTVFGPGPSAALLATRPFIWLPTVLVQAALLGHVLTYRRLAIEARLQANGRPMVDDVARKGISGELGGGGR